MSESNNTLLYGDTPLACAWLAANLEKKLSKQQYLKTSITESTLAIERSSEIDQSQPITKRLVPTGESDSQFHFLSQTQRQHNDVDDENKNNIKKETDREPITLRISGQLLYGIVKIYSRKTKYLFEEVSLALIQLKSAFAISKSITMPIEKTIVSSIDSITLKDTVTEENVLYGTGNFDINKVFGITNEISGSNSSRNTQNWAASQSFMGSTDDVDEDYAMGDISIGRNGPGNETEITSLNNTADVEIPNFEHDGNDDNIEDGYLVDDAFDVGNDSIDALARRAEVPVDDLDGAAEFNLPLDLNLKENPAGELGEDGNIPGISDFQMSAIDNMDLEFTVDETNNDADQSAVIQRNITEDAVESEGAEEEEGGEEEEEVRRTNRKRNRKHKQSISYQNTDVIRTQRKKLVVDESNEIPTDQLKKNQREYPMQLKAVQREHKNIPTLDTITNEIIHGLEPSFLNVVGTTWRSIKRRKLLEQNNADLPIDENDEEQDVQHNDYDDVPNFGNEPGGLEIEPEFPVAQPIEENEGGLNNLNNEIPDFDQPDFENDDINQEEGEVQVEGENEEENEEENNIEDPVIPAEDDFDNYDFEDLQKRNKVTVEVAHELRNVFEQDKDSTVEFEDIVERCKLSENKKSSATRAFFELLVLGTANTVKLEQDRLFGEIKIESKQGLFEKFL